jgi:hypothetical protein
MTSPVGAAARAKMAALRSSPGHALKEEVKAAAASGELADILLEAPAIARTVTPRKDRGWIKFRNGFLRPAGRLGIRLGVRAVTGGLLG